TGVGRQQCVPQSLAVWFAMLASYLQSSTLVPVLSTWMLRSAPAKEPGFFEKARSRYRGRLEQSLRLGWVLVAAYLLVAVVIVAILFPRIGTEIFPQVESKQIQLRLRAPAGTRVERTELIALKAMDVIKQQVGAKNVE